MRERAWLRNRHKELDPIRETERAEDRGTDREMREREGSAKHETLRYCSRDNQEK